MRGFDGKNQREDHVMDVNKQIKEARKHLRDAHTALGDISSLDAERHHEDTRGTLLSVLSGIRSLGEGLTVLQQRAAAHLERRDR